MALGANYRRLWAASAVSNVGDGVLLTAMPLLALRLTRSPALIAGVSLAQRLPWLLFALHAGALADRLDRRRTMVLVDLGRVAVIGGLGLVVVFDSASLALLYAVAFVLGIGETLFDTSAQSLMPSVVDHDQLSRANGRLYATEIVANQFIGPPLGGALAGAAMAAAFFSTSGAFALAAVALFLVSGRFRPARQEKTRIGADIKEGLRYLFGNPLLRDFAAMVGVMNLCNTAAFSVIALYAVRPGPLGLSEFGFGVLLTTLAAGSVVGSLLVARAERRFGRARLLVVSVVATALGVVAPAVSTRPVVVGALLFVSSMVGMPWNIITVSLRQRIIPDRLLGRVNSAYRLLAWGTMPLGALIGGLLAQLFGVRTLFFIVTVPVVALLVVPITESRLARAEAEVRPATRP